MHDFALAAVSSNRQTAADYLAEAGDIGIDVIEGLAAALSAAEAAHNLITDKESTILFSDRTHAFQEAFVRKYKAHVARSRLHDNAGDFFATLGKNLFQSRKVVERYGNSGCCYCLGYARAVRYAEGSSAAACLNKQAVMVTMVAADEFDDAVTAGVGAC